MVCGWVTSSSRRAGAAGMSRVRRCVSPRLLIPSSSTRPAVPRYRGTKPSQVTNSRPDLNAPGSPIVASAAVAPRTPTPESPRCAGSPRYSGATAADVVRSRRPARRTPPPNLGLEPALGDELAPSEFFSVREPQSPSLRPAAPHAGATVSESPRPEASGSMRMLSEAPHSSYPPPPAHERSPPR